MKKLLMPMIALAVALAATSGAFAYGNGGRGCGNCAAPSAAHQEQFRTFQRDTIDLRQEMMIKRFELQRENLKAAPDAARMAALQTEIGALQAKIRDIRAKNGLPAGRWDGECGGMGYGKGMGKGMGGCGGVPCNGPMAR
ncbi:hypothetical protein FO488_14335 [Geobacter sp. FeAm09]|uniref:hypothetical protein n=1 Tax=Geobacter sp. FeAm09 TaxID=2597769 RepID=UPI0011ECA99E|nr:hypothetical protein [Geobacter sp. FeAm09]QEM69220.1 hypothetical protein FO488_14335 [Geobacter sp. FeAm09]